MPGSDAKGNTSTDEVEVLRKRILQLEQENSRLEEENAELKATQSSPNLPKELWATIEKVDRHLEFFKQQRPFVQERIIEKLVEVKKGLEKVFHDSLDKVIYDIYMVERDGQIITERDGYDDHEYCKYFGFYKQLVQLREGKLKVSDMSNKLLELAVRLLDAEAVHLLLQKNKDYVNYDWATLLKNLYTGGANTEVSAADLVEVLLKQDSFDRVDELLDLAVVLRDGQAVDVFLQKNKEYVCDWVSLINSMYMRVFIQDDMISTADVFEVLLEQDSFDPNKVFDYCDGTRRGTLLTISLDYQDCDAVEILVKSPKVDVNFRYGEAYPLHYLIHFEYQDDDGYVPVSTEKRCSELDMKNLDVLLSRQDIDVNARMLQRGFTPFFYAMMEGKFNLALRLVEDSRFLPGVMPTLSQYTSWSDLDVFLIAVKDGKYGRYYHSTEKDAFWEIVRHFAILERNSIQTFSLAKRLPLPEDLTGVVQKFLSPVSDIFLWDVDEYPLFSDAIVPTIDTAPLLDCIRDLEIARWG